MTDQRPRYWWAISAVAILAMGLAAGLAYNIGLSQGLAQVPVPAGSVLPHVDGWYRPGGFGFLFPLMFFAFWILVMRGLFWRPWDPGATAIASTRGIAKRTPGWTGQPRTPRRIAASCSS